MQFFVKNDSRGCCFRVEDVVLKLKLLFWSRRYCFGVEDVVS